MTQDEIQQGERFDRVIAFARAHPDDFPVGKPSGQNAAILREVVAALGDLGGSQVGNEGEKRAATGRRTAILDKVRADLAGLAGVARELHDEKPDLEKSFHLPPNKRDDALLNAARAQIGLLTDPEEGKGAALVALFVDYEMPADFVTTLQSDIAAAEVAMGDQDAHGGARREDTLGIDAQIERGIRAVGKMDAACQNKYRDNATLLGAWKTASHLELHRVHPRRTA